MIHHVAVAIPAPDSPDRINTLADVRKWDPTRLGRHPGVVVLDRNPRPLEIGRRLLGQLARRQIYDRAWGSAGAPPPRPALIVRVDLGERGHRPPPRPPPRAPPRPGCAHPSGGSAWKARKRGCQPHHRHATWCKRGAAAPASYMLTPLTHTPTHPNKRIKQNADPRTMPVQPPEACVSPHADDGQDYAETETYVARRSAG